MIVQSFVLESSTSCPLDVQHSVVYMIASDRCSAEFRPGPKKKKKTAKRKSVWAGCSWDIRDPDVGASLTRALGWGVPSDSLRRYGLSILKT